LSIKGCFIVYKPKSLLHHPPQKGYRKVEENLEETIKISHRGHLNIQMNVGARESNRIEKPTCASGINVENY